MGRLVSAENTLGLVFSSVRHTEPAQSRPLILVEFDRRIVCYEFCQCASPSLFVLTEDRLCQFGAFAMVRYFRGMFTRSPLPRRIGYQCIVHHHVHFTRLFTTPFCLVNRRKRIEQSEQRIDRHQQPQQVYVKVDVQDSCKIVLVN